MIIIISPFHFFMFFQTSSMCVKRHRRHRRSHPQSRHQNVPIPNRKDQSNTRYRDVGGAAVV